MTTSTLITLSPVELSDLIEQSVARAMQRQTDRFVTRRELSDHLGVSLRSVDSWIARKNIKPVTPAGARPKYSRNEVMNKQII